MDRFKYDWWWKATRDAVARLLSLDQDGAADLVDQYSERITRNITPAEAARLIRRWEERGVPC